MLGRVSYVVRAGGSFLLRDSRARPACDRSRPWTGRGVCRLPSPAEPSKTRVFSQLGQCLFKIA
eukprot:8686896-Pyramimonas_sp.AAC.1